MRRVMIILAAVLGAVVLGAFPAVTPSWAVSSPASSAVEGTSVRTAEAGSGARMTIAVRSASGRPRIVSLRCGPTGGSHPHAEQACGILSAAGGDPRRITPADGFCTMEFAPVRATLGGWWEGRPVVYQQTFSNSCAMGLATRGLFRLQG